MRKSKASEALCVAQQVAAIRAALHKHGYQIRKRPKQAVWNVLTPLHPPKTTPLPRGSGRKLTSSSATGTEGKLTPPLARGAGGVNEETAKTHKRKCYLLTYQPAPISTWVLHPQTNDADYHALETIIQRAITRSAS
jgi:hypothetical protein